MCFNPFFLLQPLVHQATMYSIKVPQMEDNVIFYDLLYNPYLVFSQTEKQIKINNVFLKEKYIECSYLLLLFPTLVGFVLLMCHFCC